MTENSSQPFLRIALDVGFHAAKAATIHQGNLLTNNIPAVVGVGETDLGILQTGLTRQKRQQPFQVTVNGQKLLVGPYVNQYARPIERLDFDRLSRSVELQALVYTSLAQMLKLLSAPTEGAAVGLIMALPVQVLQDTEARQAVTALENWLVGEHQFDVDGQAHALHIHALKAMAQPLGSFFEWGLALDGQWGRSPADLKAHVGVLDQGFNTLDLFTLAGGQIVRRYTGGETLGMRRAASLMQDLIRQNTGRKLSLHEADRYLQESSNGNAAELLLRGEAINLRPMARQALEVAFGEMRAYLSQIWEDGSQFDYLLLTGGGALALGERLQAVYPQTVLISEPVTANARGLARFAQRQGILKPPIR
ncbi:MAG: hypothetical protein ACOYYS_11360 [Chloroflexota bacterium]